MTTAYPAVVIVDSLRAAAAHYASGQRRVVLFRGRADAQANVSRLVTNGVRRAVVRCAQDGEAITSALIAAGITVADTLEEPAPVVLEAPDIPVPHLVLVRHDPQTESVTCTAGDLTYIADVPWDIRSLVNIRIERGDQAHSDRIDLSADAQRRRFASSAAMRIGVTVAAITTHLAALHDIVRSTAEQAATLPARTSASAGMTASERSAAIALAKQSDLFAQIVADLAVIGWTGDASVRRWAFLAGISRLVEDPVWVALTGASACGLDAIAAITPPEDVIRVSRLTDSVFYHAEPTALRHKLLIIDDASRVSTAVATTLRVLKRRGALSASRITTDPVRGQARTTFIEVHGPVAVMAATTEAVDPELQPHLIELDADASANQLLEQSAIRHRRYMPSGQSNDRERMATQLRHLQRVLTPRPVVIPYLDRIIGFGAGASARREQDLLLALIAAHALLLQYQRAVIDGAVVATTADFDVVAALLNERHAAENAGLGRHAQQLLTAVWSAKLTTFTMEDLERLLPDWTRYAFRAALDALVRCEYLLSPRSGRGTARIYHLHASPLVSGSAARTIRLVDAADTMSEVVGELATVGETPIATVSPQVAHG